ncbi:MAG: PEP-CTERM sorting domain-containing protein [Rubrivivax sp.]|nr:PEP-CTERM sorting domain-containing protein [Rubrivivax sp.]
MKKTKLSVGQIGPVGAHTSTVGSRWPLDSKRFMAARPSNRVGSLGAHFDTLTPGVSMMADSGHVHAPVPEPGTWALMLAGLPGRRLARRRAARSARTYRRDVAAVALTAVLASSAAQADVSVVATISHLQLQVVDLDPQDGIAASLTFVGNPGQVTHSSVEQDRGTPYYTAAFDAGPLGAATRATVATSNASLEATTLAGNVFDPNASPSGRVTLSLREYAGGVGAVSLIAGGGTNAVISVNTRIRMTADVSSAVEHGRDWAHATTHAELRLYDDDYWTGGAELAADRVGYLWTSANCAMPTCGGQDSLFIEWDNLTGGPVEVIISANANAYAFSLVAAPVPEPATVASMAMGLALLGGLASQRRVLPA